MSPAIDSTAQSSLTVPTYSSSGSSHPEVADLGDGAPRGHRRQAGPGPGPDLAVDAVEVQVGGPAPRPVAIPG